MGMIPTSILARMSRERVQRDLNLKVARSQPLRVFVVDPSCFSLPYDHSLCHSLHKLGCNVTLVCSEYHHGIWEHPVPFQVWKSFYQWSHHRNGSATGKLLWQVGKGVEHLLSMTRFKAQMRKLNPDIIHFQWLPVPVLDNLYLRQLSEIAPLVLTVHNTSLAGRSRLVQLQQTLGVRAAFKYISAVIVHTEFSRQKVLDHNWVSRDRLHLIPHGSLDYYRSLAEAETIHSGEQTLLFFGKVAQYKGVDVLLRAFAQLPLELKNTTRLVIAGLPAGNEHRLMALATELRIDAQVKWELRYIAEEEIPGLFRSATAVVLPYLAIDQSGVLMTAIAFDRPVVATRVGGFSETIRDGVHGYLVSPGNVTELAVALRKLLSEPVRRVAMEREIRILRNGCLSWDYCGQQTLKLYDSVIRHVAQAHQDSDL